MEIQNISLNEFVELESSEQESVSWESHTVEHLSTFPGDKYVQIRERIREIGMQLEKYRSFTNENDFSLQGIVSYDSSGTITISKEQLERIEEGVSGSYFLFDLNGNKKFVIKPIDEDCGCINNPKGWDTDYISSPIRGDMPLYRSSLKEAATYEIASSIGLTSIAPKTALKIFESEQFFIHPDVAKFTQSREKLCSIQEFIPEAKSLFEIEYNIIPETTDRSQDLSYLFSLERAPSSIDFAESSRLCTDSANEQLDFILFHLEAFDPQEDLSLLEKKRLVIEWLNKQKIILGTGENVSSSSSGVPFPEIGEILTMFPKLIDLLERINKERGDEKITKMIQELEEARQFFSAFMRSFSLGGIMLDQRQYEDILILIWTTYDTDAHLGNILAHKLASDENDTPIYGLKKIDNGLAFPTKNRNLRNPLIFFPNADTPLTEEGRKKILAMDEQELVRILAFYDLEAAVPAFCERLKTLKSLAEKSNISLKEIDFQMVGLGEQYQDEEDFFSSRPMFSWSYA